MHCSQFQTPASGAAYYTGRVDAEWASACGACAQCVACQTTSFGIWYVSYFILSLFPPSGSRIMLSMRPIYRRCNEQHTFRSKPRTEKIRAGKRSSPFVRSRSLARCVLGLTGMWTIMAPCVRIARRPVRNTRKVTLCG
ncbi:hypothetical protein BD311DRAFT_762822 [Dichomitus squalens]|uniref:Uncharacterized protein n=1 Tax=Dichomitus squalens TaxID=114155 RepID=A0A4Q9MJN5_9APHY|nr:hypothetical protein BD311DRAFT_762822 [Dichomitus squalens]